MEYCSIKEYFITYSCSWFNFKINLPYMFRISSLIILVQLFCFYHAYRNGKEFWWYFLIFLMPLVGCIIYFFFHIYNQQQVGMVQEGVKQTFVKNYRINKLEKELEFANTFSNKMELAEEHSRVGNYGRALDLYESCNVGIHEDDPGLVLKLIKNNYLIEDYEEVVRYGRKLGRTKLFSQSDEKSAYAWSLFRVGREFESEGVFKEMDTPYANYKNRLEYAYFLEEANRKEDAMLNGQIEPNNKNAVYATGGTIIFVNQASLAYERSFLASDQFKTNGKIMIGKYLLNGLDLEAGERRYENYLGLGLVQMLYFVEINVGLAYASYTLAPGIGPPFDPTPDLPEIDSTKIETGLVFNGGIGIRFERNNFMIRAGLNNLELLYLGLGLAF